jgi:ADP-ribose pyrophosphatase YjhB (NUDIX family)
MGYMTEIRKVWGVDPTIRVDSSVIVENERGQILLQKRSDTLQWGLPGWAMEPGETLEDKAIRELNEATGLNITQLIFYRMFSGAEFAFTYPNREQVFNVSAIYIARQYSGHLKTTGPEKLELKFFSLFNLPAAFQETCMWIVDTFAADHFWIGG